MTTYLSRIIATVKEIFRLKYIKPDMHKTHRANWQRGPEDYNVTNIPCLNWRQDHFVVFGKSAEVN